MAEQAQTGRCSSFPWVNTLRICGAACGIAIVAVGIVNLIIPTFNIRLFINSIYLIIFGLLVVISELRMRFLLTWFQFLTHYVGIGMFYIFVAGLCLGDEWWEYIIAIIMAVVGVMYISMACCCKTMAGDRVPGPQKMDGSAAASHSAAVDKELAVTAAAMPNV